MRELVTDETLNGMMARPGFDEGVRLTLAGWSTGLASGNTMSKTLRDVGHYMAAVWTLHLHATPQGLTHTSLSAMLEASGMASKGRAHAMLIYLRFIGLIEAINDKGDARLRRYRPTPALRTMMHERYRRELTAAVGVTHHVATLLARWDEPGVFDAFMLAQGRYMMGAVHAFEWPQPSLDVFSHRNAGLTILAKLMLGAGEEEAFPPFGPAPYSVSELARSCGVSRAHVRGLLHAGAEAGFLTLGPDSQVAFTAELHLQLRALLAMYWLCLDWCAGEVLGSNI